MVTVDLPPKLLQFEARRRAKKKPGIAAGPRPSFAIDDLVVEHHLVGAFPGFE
jgi:hypothetical protein